MYLTWQDNSLTTIDLEQGPLKEHYLRAYKHLQHLPLTFYPWDNPYFRHVDNRVLTLEHLAKSAQCLNIHINTDACLAQDQTELNRLHKIYEQHFDGTRPWLEFHELVHVCEQKTQWAPNFFVNLGHREQAGMFEIPFKQEWTALCSTKLKAGDVFVFWSELGKTAYDYYHDGEPDDIQRVCELVKPWLVVRPKIQIALVDHDALENLDCSGFETWWKQYHNDWCKHWGISQWGIEQVFGKLRIGRAQDPDAIASRLQQNILPTGIKC